MQNLGTKSHYVDGLRKMET